MYAVTTNSPFNEGADISATNIVPHDRKYSIAPAVLSMHLGETFNIRASMSGGAIFNTVATHMNAHNLMHGCRGKKICSDKIMRRAMAPMILRSFSMIYTFVHMKQT